LACVNFWLAATIGLLLAFDKFAHFLPGFVLTNVFAHAHLAALGWAAMMVVGVGYRMLPMTIPSKIPTGPSVYASAALLEMGVLGLFTSLLFGSRLSWIFGLVVAGGFAVFFGHIVWMVRHRVTRPVGAARVDFGLLHAASAGMSLLVATTIGLAMLIV